MKRVKKVKSFKMAKIEKKSENSFLESNPKFAPEIYLLSTNLFSHLGPETIVDIPSEIAWSGKRFSF
jgi:hypothetical protein